MDDVLQIPAVNLSKRSVNGGGQLFYSMHVNNRLYDQVKEQVDSMRCRTGQGPKTEA